MVVRSGRHARGIPVVAMMHSVLVITLGLMTVDSFVVFPTQQQQQQQQQQQIRSAHKPAADANHLPRIRGLLLQSSFYGDFEQFDNDDEDEDEDDDDDDDLDEYIEELDEQKLAEFRSKMSSLFDDDGKDSPPSMTVSSVDELIDFARSSSSSSSTSTSSTSRQTTEVSVTTSTDWATATDTIQEGVVLLANPAKFCVSDRTTGMMPNTALLSKFGLTMPPPIELGPDRRADLLPVLMVVEINSRTIRAVLLNRRTGYLLGDLVEQSSSSSDGSDNNNNNNNNNDDEPMSTPLLEKFCIQPLWFGGIDNLSSGLDMLHQCPAVIGSKRLTHDGLYWGGDPRQAQDAMMDVSSDPNNNNGRVWTGFDFKFFVQTTLWSPKELNKQVTDQTWFCAKVSKEVIFKSRDRMGTRRAKPLWTEIMELMGGNFQQIRDRLYEEES